MMNRKGFYNQLVIVIIFGAILLGIMLLIFGLALLMPIITKASDNINTITTGAARQSNDNASIQATNVLSNVNGGVQQLKWISYTVIIVLLIVFVLMCFYVRTYPFLSIIWIFIVIFLAGLSLFLTTAYQDVASKGGFIGDALASSKDTNSIALWLPYIIVGIGIVGGIAMFILGSRENEAEISGGFG